MDLFNEAEVNTEVNDTEAGNKIVIAAHKRKKHTGKKEDLSSFEVTETIEYKLIGENDLTLTMNFRTSLEQNRKNKLSRPMGGLFKRSSSR